jgi:flagellar protein FlbD
MILLTRLNGTEVGVNADLIERVEATPDTVLSLIDGTKYLVRESPADVVARVIAFRARVLALAERIGDADPADPDAGTPTRAPRSGLRLVADAMAED